MKNYFAKLREDDVDVVCLNDDFDTSGDDKILADQLKVLDAYLDEVRPRTLQVVDRSLCHAGSAEKGPLPTAQ